MGLGCVLFGWSVVAAAAATVLVAGVLITRTRFRALGWVLVVPAALVLIVAVFFIVGWLTEPLRRNSTGPAAYTRVFGEPPPAGVEEVRSYWAASTDSDVIFLRFRCAAASIPGIIGQRSTSDRTEGFSAEVHGGRPRPDWWDLRDSAALKVWVLPEFNTWHPAPRAWLVLDDASQTCYFYYEGIT